MVAGVVEGVEGPLAEEVRVERVQGLLVMEIHEAEKELGRAEAGEMKYYDYEQGVTPSEACYKLKEHLRINLKNMLYHEGVNADKRVSQAQSGTRRDVKSLHIDKYYGTPSVIGGILKSSSQCLRRSKQNKENRTHGNKIEHTNGAKPYIIFRKDLLLNSWYEYRQSLIAENEEGNNCEAHTCPPLSPSKRRRVEAEHLKTRKKSARLLDELLQHVIDDVFCIFHALNVRYKDNDISVPRSELDQEIQQLAVITLSKEDVHWTEYIHVASSVVDKMLDKFGKTINEGLLVMNS
ncbi:hypothetical protein ACET3Z_000874 [Daucus carota]